MSSKFKQNVLISKHSHLQAPAMTRILLVMYPLSWFLTMIMEDFMVRLTSPQGVIL